MDNEFTSLALAIVGILFMVVLPIMAGIYLWLCGYTTAVIVEGIVWFFVIAILRDWLQED